MANSSVRIGKSFIATIAIACVVTIVVASYWPRTQAMDAALQPLIAQSDSEQSSVASAILHNYRETRANARKWSGVYWGFTFTAAILSALAGIILKVESIFSDNEKMKRDVAAIFSLCAALLITISTSGDFQRKWQANRIAASELEKAGYDFLNNREAEPRAYYSLIGNILHKRNLAIVGNLSRDN